MHKVIDALYHHGKTHHKKYLWGVAGFFGLFKIFSFLIVSIVSYTAINAQNMDFVPSTESSEIISNNLLKSIIIPAATIDIQDNKSIIQFDLSDVDIGSYEKIKNINLSMNIDTEEQSVDMETLRNTTSMNIGPANDTQTLPLKLRKTEDDLRTIDAEDISGIIEQLLTGNTIAYFFPQENITLQSGNSNIFMEITVQNTEIVQQPEEIVQQSEEIVQQSADQTGNSEELTQSIPETTETALGEPGSFETTGNNLQISPSSDIIGTNLQISPCDQYTKKKNCNNDEGCIRNKEFKTCESNQTIDKEENYQLAIGDPDNIETAQEVIVHSKKNTKNINGYLKIRKQTKIKINKGHTAIQFQAPTLVTDPNLQGAVPKEGIPDNFVHIETVQVGDPTLHITVDTGSSGFVIDMEIVNISMIPGTILHIYTSQDGIVRENLHTTCTIDDQNMCEFTTPHLTLFAVGTITRNNMQFINQDFRDMNPTTGQIIDALFGTGGNPSAYTTHRISTGCRPADTSVSYYNGSGGTSIVFMAPTILIFSGTYTFNGSLNLNLGGNCVALLGKGNVIINKKNGGSIFMNYPDATGLIIDNIQMNGSGNTGEMILLTGINDTTINDVQSYNGNSSSSYGISIYNSNQNLINNSQTFDTYIGIGIERTKGEIINNSQSYNNSYGIYTNNSSGVIINNSEMYNNSSNGGMNIHNTQGLVINNIQIYNNALYGIMLWNNTSNVKMNNSRIFNNSIDQIYADSTSSGRYYGNNRIYPITSFANFSTGNYDASLGRATGTISTTDLGFSCDFVTNPINGFGTGLYSTSDCSDVGSVSAWNYKEIVKYRYGNNMLSGKNVLRQIQPVIRAPSLSLSNIPYDGHRFIGEYDDPSGRDINIPVAIFTGETPPQGYNVINSGYFTVRSYIYEPNLYSAARYENINGVTTYNSIYDSGLILMLNMDNVKEIGETSILVKDNSIYKQYGTVYGSAVWTGNGKRNGAYIFPTTTAYIGFSIFTGTSQLNPDYISIFARVNPTTTAGNKNIVSRGNVAYRFRIDNSSNKLRTYMVRNGGGACGITSNLPAVPTNSWSFVGVTYDGTAIRFYLNTGGTTSEDIQSATACSGVLNKTISAGLYIGSYVGSSETFSGLLDEVRIYNRALSSGEIDHLYHSNLSAKADHREYVVNYTGVSSWLYGPFTYGFSTTTPLTDAGSNTGSSTGYVMKYPTNCTSSFWNNDNFITGAFWSASPTDCDIVLALYGTGTDGSDHTAYTINRSGRTNQCSYQNMNVIYTGNLYLTTLASNTIYVLTGPISTGNGTITLGNNCSAIVSSNSTGTTFYSTTQLYYMGMFHGNVQSRNIIFDNIAINGTGGGPVPAHIRNTYGMYLGNTSNSTFNNIQVYNNDIIGIVMNYNNTLNNIQVYNNGNHAIIIGSYNTLNNIHSYNNTYGIFFADNSSNNTLNNIQSHNNLNGIYLADYSSNNTLNNIQSYNNSQNGIQFMYSSGNTINNIQSYNNNQNGIYLNVSSNNTINNTQIYSNTGAGIYIYGPNDHITLNNIQSFNNQYGLDTSTTIAKDYITVNNSQFYNNSGDGLRLYTTSYFTINNSHIYNNSGNGIYFAGASNSTGTLNNVWTYNNGNIGAYSFGGNHIRYGKLTMFGNAGGNTVGSFTAGTSGTYSYIGWTGGTTDTTPCMSCSRVTNPRTAFYVDFIDTTLYPKCQMRGINNTWTGIDDLDYKYGINITGQKLPVFWSGTILTGSSLAYSGSQHVAEINKIGTYTDTQCSCLGTSYTRNNDNFITGSFWTANPNYCQIIAALYGSGTTGTDTTAYTKLWNGRSGQCNPENMQVVSTGRLSLTVLAEKTIYVLTGPISTGSATINMNNCSAVVSRNTTGTTFSSDTALTNGMFAGITTQYGIFDNIAINGTGGGPVPAHSANTYGIRLSNSSKNNTLNNIQTYDNQMGIYLNISSNNTISNSQNYNNTHGIFIDSYSNNNTINNSQNYNNNNGIFIYYHSDNNTINNSQNYNNSSEGIFLADASNNTINNSQNYNNDNNGIFIGGASNNNTLNNIQSYNNPYGIYLDPGSAGNKYYGTSTVFNNTTANIGGTATNLTTGSSSDYTGFGRTTGALIQTGIMSRDIITNPVNASNAYLMPWTGTWTGIIGIQTFTATLPMRYSYGSGILTQIQPVYYSGTTLKTGGLFDVTKFIGSDLVKVTGDILGLTGRKRLTVTGTAGSALITKYSVFGDIMSYRIGQNINTSTGIVLTTGDRMKRIITQLSGTAYFGMHFERDTTLDTIPDCMTGWDNNNFLSGAFWTNSPAPTDENIICALYGTGPGDTTAYTKFWSGRDTNQCSGVQINVVYTGRLSPTALAANTIYVLTGPISTGSATIGPNNCNAIISNNSTGTTFYSTLYLSTAMFSATTKQYMIFDNIDINGTGGGPVPAHTGNANGIVLQTVSSSTLNNIQSYNNQYGIALASANKNILNSIQTYNNQFGISIQGSSYSNTTNNIQSYNNQYGIYLYSSPNNTFNNIQTYNNQIGISINRAGSNNIFNNIQSYNNSQYGVQTNGNNKFNNFQIYNNQYGISSLYGITMPYYGTCLLFNNISGTVDGPGFPGAGSSSDYPGLERNTGVLITGTTLSRDYITNPVDASNNYLLSWTGTWTGIIGQQTGYKNSITDKYSYGSGILTQIQPVYFSGSTLTSGGLFDAVKYIGSDMIPYTGDLLGIPAITYNTLGLTVTGMALASQISGYNLYGNMIKSYLGMTINTKTGIVLDTGDQIKRIITQIYSPTYFATHFEHSTTLDADIDCASRRDNDNFITGAFWTTGTTDNNIICALYGTGPGDTTAYTKLRSGRDTTQCSGVQINVVYTGKLALTTLAANTIYVLTGPVSTGSASEITIADCSAVVSRNVTGTTFSTTILANNIFYGNGKKYSIFDNIAINGTGLAGSPHVANDYGIQLYNSSNNTLNTIQIYNNGQNGIDFSASSNNILNNIQSYNNSIHGIYLTNSSNNNFNNIQSYNNNSAGISLNSSSKNNTLNNFQSYNNQYGIYAYSSSGNILNNIQSYNNQYGIYLYSSSGNILNNIQSYNNDYGIGLISSPNSKYYSTGILFNNTLGNIDGAGLAAGSASDYPGLGRSDGNLVVTGITISWDYITNPANTGGSYLLAWTGLFTGMQGQQTSYFTNITNKYSYGSGILTQTQPVYYSGTTLKTGGLFDATKYIGSTIIRYTGDLIGLPTITTLTGLFTVTGTANAALVNRYSLFGNIIAYKSGQAINTSTGIYITTGDAVKRIIMQIYSGTEYFATHFEHSILLDTHVDCLTGWDNDNFISGAFRDGNPTTGNIICALYGAGPYLSSWPGDTTAYTKLWSGRDNSKCLGVNMNVVYTGKLSLTTLATNTIYVLTGPISTGSATINMATCSAIISNNGTGTTFYSTGYLANGMFSAAATKQYTIFDNIDINGTGGGPVPAHAGNVYGIRLITSSNNNTLNNFQSYNNQYGIYLNSSLNNILNNIQNYNNSVDGIYLYSSSNNTLNNIQCYNNGLPNGNGITLTNVSNNNTLNNIQSYNNGLNTVATYGIYLNNSSNNTMNNIQTYNNGRYGIYLYSSSNNNILNTIKSYNNFLCGIALNGSSNNKYYGTGIIFNNSGGNILGAGLITGYASDYPGFGRSDGVLIQTGIMSREYITNPANTDNNYFLPWTGALTEILGQQTGYQNTITDKYSYGSGIMTQIQPVYYSGTTLKTGGLFDATKYIGSNITRYTGDSIGLPASVITTGQFTITGIANAALISNYSLFGNIFAYKIGQAINTSTGIYLTTGDAVKRVIMQIYSGTDFATHFEHSTTLDTFMNCMTGWDNSNFITGAFWNLLPTDENIICALYGTGPGDTTAYTKLWSGRDTTQCSGLQINVVYTGIVPQNLSTNTIYVIASGTYNISTSRNMATCSVLISSGNAIIQKNASVISIYASGTSNSIIDNMKVDSNGFDYGGIWLQDSSNNNTINNSQTYNSAGNYCAGIAILRSGNNNIINNSQSYNNCSYGIYIGENSKNNIINNSQSYNNNYGIAFYNAASNNTINNSQTYNNISNGIWLYGSTKNTINNIQSYNNNDYGIYFNNSSGNTLNNIQSYNNGQYGIYFNNASDNKYYGTGILFNNASGNTGGTDNLTQGTGTYFASLGRTTGTLIQTGIMSRDLVTNPANTGGVYMLIWTGLFTGIQGQQINYTGIITDKYSYGSGIMTQIQPVYYSGTTLTTGGFFDATKYIGSDITRYTGDLLGISTFSNTGLTVTGTAIISQISGYNLYGDLINPYLGITINTKTGIFLSDTDGLKRIITQIYSPTYFATHFEHSTILDATLPVVGIAEIYVGTTGFNSPNYYYKGTGDIRAAVSDANISGNSCQYTTGSSWLAALYSGAGYCYKTGLSFTTGITINFRIRDLAGNLGTGTARLYMYDITPPTFTFANTTGSECAAGTLTITAAADTGVGLHTTPYSFDNITWDTTTSTGIAAQQPGVQVRTGRVRDALFNIGFTGATYTFNNIVPTATDFTGNFNVGSTPKTADRLLSGNVTEGACGIGDIAYSGMVTQGTKGVCTVSGTGITYTPNANQIGSDFCIIQVKDNENSTVNIRVGRENIDTNIDCAARWDNDNFLTGRFRTAGTPTDENIICALYGTGPGDTTAYTQLWSGWNTTQCSGLQMIVTGLTAGSDILPITLTSNTIYVLSGGTYSNTATRNMENCSAIVGKGDAEIQANFSSATRLISSTTKNYRILDNLRLNRNVLGAAANQDVLYITTSTKNTTANDIQAYNGRIGIYINSASSSNLINNSKSYNNISYGIYIFSASIRNIVNNSQVYNNAGYGIYMNVSASGNTVNNSQVYNNDNIGIYIRSGSNNNVLNNVESYNNSSRGLYIIESINNSINNSRIYNNNSNGIWLDATSVGNKYYGSGNIFANAAAAIGGTVANLTTGYASDYPGLGRSDGTLVTTGTMSRDYITNPINTGGSYLLAWTGAFTGMSGQQISYTGTATERYSYGSGILTQIQPVYYSGTTLTTGGLFNAAKYIGSTITRYTGNLLGISAFTYAAGLTVSGTANAAWINAYSLFGDISSYKVGQAINTNTGISLTAGDGIKRVITQIYSGNDFATHFEKSTTLDTFMDCMTGWDNSNFITGAFWDNNPTDQNIICALYGTGPGDTTAYTQLWSGWNTTQCSGLQMIVTGLTAGSDILPITLTSNTIYVLSGGTYSNTATRNMENCSAIVGKGDTEIQANFSSATRLISSTTKNYRILDNLKLNRNVLGAAANQDVLYITTSTKNTTANDIQAYNGRIGIYINSASNNNLINNSKIYNNTYGIYINSASNNNVLNNIQVYNNANYGIYMYVSSSSNTVNNSQVYNNSNIGIYIRSGSNNNVMNNVGVYNNSSRGLSIIEASINNSINNSRMYNNNSYGIYLDATSVGNKYYGSSNIFANALAAIGGTVANLTTGSASDYPGLGRSDGTIATGGIMSRDFIINPINTTSNYLLAWTGIFTGLRGQQISYTGQTTAYSYGSSILTQIQPVYYSGATLTTGGLFDAAEYIGSDAVKVTGDIEGIPPFFISGSTVTLTVTGVSSDPLIVRYSIFGNIIANILGQTINTSTGITLKTGLSINRVITQIYDPVGYFATHFQKDAAPDTTKPSQVLLISPLSGSIIPNNDIQLVRSAAIDTGIGMGTYVYQVSTGITFTTLVTSGTTSDTGYLVTGLPVKTYYWRVYAIDLAGNTGLWSEIRNFKVAIPIACIGSWDNSNFITGAFRALNPNDENIICALYGSGGSDQTAYTNIRSGYKQSSCLDNGMSIMNIQPGTGQIPLNAGPNIIYVLSSGAYIQTGAINLKACTAIIGTTGASILYTTTGLIIPEGVIVSQNAGQQFQILDNFSMDGTGNGLGGTHERNTRSIRFNNGYGNTTINNIDVYNHGSNVYIIKNNNQIMNSQFHNNGVAGVMLLGINNIIGDSKIYGHDGVGLGLDSGNKVNNCEIYNNQVGIQLYDHANNNIINNSQIYNNSLHGIYIWQQSNNNIINNSQIYNNGTYGIYITNYSRKNTINNSQIYNNHQDGIHIYNYSSENIINNVWSYNNGYSLTDYGIITNNSTGNIYYGTSYFFGNTTHDILADLTGGTGIYYAALGRTTGALVYGTAMSMTRDFITNPINTDSNYLLSWTGTWTGIRDQQTNYTETVTERYSYGSGILTQIQPVIRSGTSLAASGIFDAAKYIGSTEIIKITGDASIFGSTITGASINGSITKYNVLGDITSFRIGQTINTSTGITFTTGLAINRIVTQLYDPVGYFATHFQKGVTIAAPIIYFTGTTPLSGATITGNSFAPQIEIINTPYIDTFTYTFNGITYPYYDSGLLLMMNFDNVLGLGETTGDIIKDLSQYAKNGSGFSGVAWTSNGRRGGAYEFDGINDYIRVPNLGISSGTSFTLAGWVKPSNTSSYATFMGYNGLRRFLINCTTMKVMVQFGGNFISTNTINPLNTRSHIVYMYDASNNKEYFYINGMYDSEHTPTATPTWNSSFLIGQYDFVNYKFSGSIDEVRVYNHTLSSGEISQMYRSNFAKYDTGSRRFTDDRQCMVNGTYTYTGYVLNDWQLSATTGRTTTVNIANRDAIAPIGYSVGSTGFSSSQRIMSGQFTGYFKVEDWKGTSGRYTTIAFPERMSGMNFTGNYIDRTNIRFMATGVDLIGGSSTSSVYVTGSLGTYQTGYDPKKYIVRDNAPFGQYSCPAGIYGNKPYIEITLPAWQNPDTYSGQVNIYIYFP